MATTHDQSSTQHPLQPGFLYPFVGDPRQPMPEGLPFRLQDYLELMDWTGRCLRDDKRGAIPEHLPPILDRLNLSADAWLQLSQGFEHRSPTFAGHPEQVQAACTIFGQRWAHGIKAARRLFTG